MKTARLVPILFPLVAACGPHQMAVSATIGGPELALKQPITDRCAAATLQGCPDLVDGSITYLGGDKVKGKDTLTRAAAQNAPEKVKSFADQIRAAPAQHDPRHLGPRSADHRDRGHPGGRPGRRGQRGSAAPPAPASPRRATTRRRWCCRA